MKVLVCDGLDNDAAQAIRDAGHDLDLRKGVSADELLELIPAYEAVVIRSATKITPAVLERASNLKLVVRGGVGFGRSRLCPLLFRIHLLTTLHHGNAGLRVQDTDKRCLCQDYARVRPAREQGHFLALPMRFTIIVLVLGRFPWLFLYLVCVSNHIS